MAMGTQISRVSHRSSLRINSSTTQIVSTFQELKKHQQVERVTSSIRCSVSSSSVFTIQATQRSQIQFIILAAFAYILSPIDFIPEAIFGIFGLLDDILFLIMCILCIAIILIYPIFRELQRAIFDKLGLKDKLIQTNKPL